MRLPAPIEKFAEQYFVPHASAIVWAAVLVLLAIITFASEEESFAFLNV